MRLFLSNTIRKKDNAMRMLSSIARMPGQDTAYSYALKRGGGCGRACSPHTGPVRVLCGGYGITPDVLIFEGRIAQQGDRGRRVTALVGRKSRE